MSRDSWGTPRYLFHWIQKMYPVDVDVCASEDNHLLPLFFTEDKSCLENDWASITKTGYVYCNPPYSNPLPYIKAAVEHADRGITTVLLVNLDPSTKWFELALTRAATVFILTGGRVQFVPPQGVLASTNPKPQCVLVIGDCKVHPITAYVNLNSIRGNTDEPPR